MDALKIAEVKDSILCYLADHANEKVLLSVMYQDLKLENIPTEVVHDCVEDMVQDNIISCFDLSGGRNLYSIKEQGERRLREGGYKKLMEIELEKAGQIKEDTQKYRDKTNLEIANLKASLKHYKHTRRISIWAIIISVASFIASILFKVF